MPKTLPDRIKLTLNAPSAFLEEIEPQRADDAATDALLHWFQEDFEGRGISPDNIELQAENGCAGSQVLRELSAAKLYFLAQRQFWRPLRGLLLFRSMPIKDNPLFALIATHGDHLASALIQARTQIEKTPKWEDHFKALYIRAQQQGYVGLEHFVEAGFPTFEDPCLLVYPSYQEPPRDIQLEDGSLHLSSPASGSTWSDGSWLLPFGYGVIFMSSMATSLIKEVLNEATHLHRSVFCPLKLRRESGRAHRI